ncbi:hypothetical protein SLE2022_176960 [Rubroshorea leprosula]
MAFLRLLPQLFSLFVSLFVAEIRFSEIRFDNLPIIPFDKFRFTHTGHLKLNVSNIDLSNQKPQSFQGWVLFLHQRCMAAHAPTTPRERYLVALQSDLVKSVFTFNSLNGKKSFHKLYQENDADQYTLVFADYLSEVKVSMTIRSVIFNLDGFEKNPNLERKKKG